MRTGRSEFPRASVRTLSAEAMSLYDRGRKWVWFFFLIAIAKSGDDRSSGSPAVERRIRVFKRYMRIGWCWVPAQQVISIFLVIVELALVLVSQNWKYGISPFTACESVSVRNTWRFDLWILENQVPPIFRWDSEGITASAPGLVRSGASSPVLQHVVVQIQSNVTNKQS